VFIAKLYENCLNIFQGFAIEGPSEAKINCEDKGDGSCDVKYYPTEPGEYAVHVICDDNDIQGSPFMAKIEPADDKTFPERVCKVLHCSFNVRSYFCTVLLFDVRVLLMCCLL